MKSEKVSDGELAYYTLRNLCAKENELVRRDALDAYLKGGLHAACLAAEAFTDDLLDVRRNLAAGKLSPRLRFVCCRECFMMVLCERLEYSFNGYEANMDVLDDDDMAKDYLYEEYNAESESLSGLVKRELILKATQTWYANNDIDRRDAYVAALRDLLRCGAEQAKAIGAERVAHDLLLASRYTYPKKVPSHAVDRPTKSAPLLTPSEADDFHAAIENALSELWAAMEYAKLKPSRSGKKRKGRR